MDLCAAEKQLHCKIQVFNSYAEEKCLLKGFQDQQM